MTSVNVSFSIMKEKKVEFSGRNLNHEKRHKVENANYTRKGTQGTIRQKGPHPYGFNYLVRRKLSSI